MRIFAPSCFSSFFLPRFFFRTKSTTDYFLGLKVAPDLFQSYIRLPVALQDSLLKGLEAQFNFAQLVQAENIPGSLVGMTKLEKESLLTLDLFNLHALFGTKNRVVQFYPDMAGAAGAVDAYGSVVLNEDTYQDIMLAISSVDTVVKGSSITEVYASQ